MTAGAGDLAACEMLFAEALRPVASDLRLVDLAALVDDVRAGRAADLGDLVASAAELHFAPHALRFSGGACCGLRWGHAPAVALDLEFHSRGFVAFLRLTLGGADAAVEIAGMNVAVGAPADRVATVAAAISAARRQPRTSRVKESGGTQTPEPAPWPPSPFSPSPPVRPNG